MPDATYVEHHYGTFEGRDAIHAWIAETMAQWPNSEMKEFPHDWCVCDEARGWLATAHQQVRALELVLETRAGERAAKAHRVAINHAVAADADVGGCAHADGDDACQRPDRRRSRVAEADLPTRPAGDDVAEVTATVSAQLRDRPPHGVGALNA